MARFQLRNKSLNNTGFDNSTGNTSGRLVNKDGSSNVRREGIPFLSRFSAYHTFINMPLWLFILSSLAAFILVNVVFACYYYLLGPESLGIAPSVSQSLLFSECFFFSVQTITTVGYGHYYPITFHANVISAIETLFGWMAFAVLTGLLYGRFSRPKSYLMFSRHALISPYKDMKGFMFRLAPYKNTIITEASVRLNVSLIQHENGKPINRFYPLELEIDKISTLALNWTIVHPITEESPLYNLTAEAMKEQELEVIVFFRAFDEHFSNTIQQRYSYRHDEIICDAKFVQMFRRSHDEQHTILELNKIDEYTKL